MGREAFKAGSKHCSAKFCCKYCNASCFSSRTLSHHIRQVHALEFKSETRHCEFCLKEFKPGKNRDVNLKNHIQRVHPSHEKPGESLQNNFKKMLQKFSKS